MKFLGVLSVLLTIGALVLTVVGGCMLAFNILPFFFAEAPAGSYHSALVGLILIIVAKCLGGLLTLIGGTILKLFQ